MMLALLPMLIGTRYRYSDDAESDQSSRVPLLGIVPALNGRKSDGEQEYGAAHSVHQIRIMLQSRAPRADTCIYMVTSGAAGEGKTTLTMALGLSFAAAHLRTLVIDCDMIGRHLTSAFHAEGMEGLQEALASGSIKKLVRKVEGGLYVLTSGKAGHANACAIPAAAIRALFAEARRYFDVVLIDTGPILGSLEAAELAQAVDGVIFTVGRGQRRELVHKAIQRLRGFGVRIEGLVFNRARPEDFYRSAYSSNGTSLGSVPATAAAEGKSRGDQFVSFGPIVSAVASGMPAALRTPVA
jgi:Mrp family chromosome partitioning ATPase